MNTLVTLKDVLDAGVCASGIYRYCLKHNIDYSKLSTTGVHVSDAPNDAITRKIIRIKNGK